MCVATMGREEGVELARGSTWAGKKERLLYVERGVQARRGKRGNGREGRGRKSDIV